MPHSALPPEIQRVCDALQHLDAPWAIAGGWALDLWLGRVTRPHQDVDVAVLRRDQLKVRAALPGWSLRTVTRGVFTAWSGATVIELPTHELHADPPAGSEASAIELLLNEVDGADWVYRRDPAIRLPLAATWLAVDGGVHVLAPEVVLLYKSKAPRAIDERDFAAVMPHLAADSREWLTRAIARAAT
jgi:hypothetical protein